MDDKRKDHIDPKGPKKRKRPKQLQTHNLPIVDVENNHSTNKGRYLLLSKRRVYSQRKDAAKDPEA